MLRINLDKPRITIEHSKHIDDDSGFRVSKCCNVRVIMEYELPGNVYCCEPDSNTVCPECMTLNPKTRPERKGIYTIFNWVSFLSMPVVFKGDDSNNPIDYRERIWLARVEKNRQTNKT